MDEKQSEKQIKPQQILSKSAIYGSEPISQTRLVAKNDSQESMKK
jgi:hypothetical protein